jgi:hypothetical protein
VACEEEKRCIRSEKKDERGRDVKVVEERNGDERRVPMLDRVER